jgi:hypothetical protein
MQLSDIGDDARRQYIDARATFEAWEAAKKEAAAVRGGMRWKNVRDTDYLIRTVGRSDTSLGPKSPETNAMYERFQGRKAMAEERMAGLEKQLARQRKLNRALLVGRAPQILVDLLRAFDDAGIAAHFLTIGTHALYAYEAAAGARFEADALATRDVDLLWDTSKRIRFVAQMRLMQTSLLGMLRRVDPTFAIKEGQPYTAVNSSGFEVDVVRREPKDLDPHPLNLTADEDELYAVPARRAEVLLGSPRLSAVIVSASGQMARMTTVSPRAFASFKRWMAEQPDREGLKRDRDLLQAELVEALVDEYLPQFKR